MDTLLPHSLARVVELQEYTCVVYIIKKCSGRNKKVLFYLKVKLSINDKFAAVGLKLIFANANPY